MIHRSNYNNTWQQAFKEMFLSANDGLSLISSANWDTMPNPTNGVASSLGWAIYAFADAAQATEPVFVKIELLWSSNNSVTDLGVTIGAGASGDSVTGAFFSSTQSMTRNSPNVDTSTGIRDYFSVGTASRLTLDYGRGHVQYGNFTVHLERSGSQLLLLLASRFTAGPKDYVFLIDRTGYELLTNQQLNTSGYGIGLMDGARSFEPNVSTSATSTIAPVFQDLVWLGTYDTAPGVIAINHPTPRRFLMPRKYVTNGRIYQVPAFALPGGS